MLQVHNWDYYDNIINVGAIQVKEIMKFPSPIRFLQEMEHDLLVNVYDKLCSQNGGSQWTSVLNCQIITRESIRYFGGKYPDGIKVISDCMPHLVDIYLQSCLLTSVLNEKKTDDKFNKLLI